MKRLILPLLIITSGLVFGAQEISSKQALDAVLKNGNATAVVFYSPSCPHCQRYKPIFERQLKGNSGVDAVLVNAASSTSLARSYGVAGVPKTVIFDKDGNKVNEFGGNNKGSLISALKKVAPAKAPTKK